MEESEVKTEIENNENSFKNANEVEGTEREEMTRYYQRYNPRLGKWVKIDADTGLIVSVKKSTGKYKNIPDKPPRTRKIRKKKGFFDYF